jgi:hypothetical protein
MRLDDKEVFVAMLGLGPSYKKLDWNNLYINEAFSRNILRTNGLTRFAATGKTLLIPAVGFLTKSLSRLIVAHSPCLPSAAVPLLPLPFS